MTWCKKSASSLSRNALILELPTVKLSVRVAVITCRQGLKQVVTFLFAYTDPVVPQTQTGCINKTVVLMTVRCSPVREKQKDSDGQRESKQGMPEWKK